jgi:hypothetical protein
VSVVQAKAEINVKEYKTRMALDDASRAMTKAYIRGLGEGMAWANIDQARLYCPPGQLALVLENFIDIIDRQIEMRSTRWPQAELDKTYIGLLLFAGLKKTFLFC